MPKKKWFKPKMKSLLSITDIEKGIWQFMIDHGQWIGNNKRLYINFVIDGENVDQMKNNIISRIFSRASGLYKIKNEKEFIDESKKEGQLMFILKERYRKSTRRETKINKLPKYKKLIIITLRKILNHFIEIWTKPEKK